MALNLDIVDPILVDKTLSGYPFLRKTSVIILISALILSFEQIINAQWLKYLTRLIFLDFGTKESQLVYKPVKVGLRYTLVVKEERSFSTNTSRKGNILSFPIP